MMNELSGFPLPHVSVGQRIGQLALKAFNAKMPSNWFVTSLAGDEDFGYDAQIQIMNEACEVHDIFRMQLKGTANPELISGGTAYSLPIKISTLHYWSRSTEPPLLVLCDLEGHLDDPLNSSLYYRWIPEETEEILKRGMKHGQSEISFHIPKANLLTNSFNPAEYIERQRVKSSVANRLDVYVGLLNPNLNHMERAGLLSRIPEGLSHRSPVLLEAIIENPNSSWIEAPRDSMPWHLGEALALMRRGDFNAVAEHLLFVEKNLSAAVLSEQIDYWHCLGRYKSYYLDDCGALDAFQKACELSEDNSRHLVPWAEMFLRLNFSPDSMPDLSSAIDRLRSLDPAVVGMKARLLAAGRNYDSAFKLASGIEGVDGHAARAIIWGMQGVGAESVQECDLGLECTSLRESTRVMFLILRARANFLQAIPSASIDQIDEMPMTGPAGAKAGPLHAVWEDILRVVPILRSLGWPTNTELLVDVWVPTAAMLGRQRDALPLLVEAGSARPDMQQLQAGLESLAAQLGEWQIAIAANQRQDLSVYVKLRRIALMHLARRHGECVRCMLEFEAELDANHYLFGFSVGFAILSAELVFRSELVLRWMVLLENLPKHHAYLALVNYFRAIEKSPFEIEKALVLLQEKYVELGKPMVIAMQLFHELNSCDPLHAGDVINIANDILCDRLLDVNGSIHLAQAYITLGRWDELLQISDSASARFDGDDRLASIGCLALDHLGRSGEALSRLKEIVSKPLPDPLALNTYIAISSRSGFAEEAAVCLEYLSAKEVDPVKRIEFLRGLFCLIQLDSPADSKLLGIAVQIGRLVDQTNEEQEGLYILCMMQATIVDGVQIDDFEKREWHMRMEGYFNRFPDSKIVNRVLVPENATPDEIFLALENLSGVSEERRRWRQEMKFAMQRGTGVMPFSWRPRVCLDGIPDVPTLWEVAKGSKWNEAHYHLTMAGPEWTPVPLADVRGRVPLFDLISLLILKDLGIFDLVFRLFPRIAIPKSVLVQILHFLSPFGGAHARQSVKDVQHILKENFWRIEQPSIILPGAPGEIDQSEDSAKIEEIMKSGYILYSDDWIFRMYLEVLTPGKISLCVLDIIDMLEKSGMITCERAANLLAVLSNWKVGIRVSLRMELALLPDSLKDASDVSEGVETIRGCRPCYDLLRAVWNPGKAWIDLLKQASYFLCVLLAEPRNNMVSVSSLLALWNSMVQLHPKAPAPTGMTLAMSIAFAASMGPTPDPVLSKRLWESYFNVVAHCYGDRMDDNKYRESMTLMGRLAAKLDFHIGSSDVRSLRHRLGIGMTPGTSEYDQFIRSYTEKFIELKQEGKTLA